MAKVGRPSSFTQKLADDICEQLSEGKSLQTICKPKAMPSRSTVDRWRDSNPGFGGMYARAREARADFRSDNISRLCKMVEAGTIDPQAANVIINAEKWQAAKENSGRYGDRQQLDHTNDGKKFADVRDIPLDELASMLAAIKKREE